jgi:hypothetical protein
MLLFNYLAFEKIKPSVCLLLAGRSDTWTNIIRSYYIMNKSDVMYVRNIMNECDVP